MWKGPLLQSYYLNIETLIRDKLSKEDPEYILNVDPGEYLEHLVKEASWLLGITNSAMS